MYETWDDMKNWKIVLTGIVFGVNLLWPVPIEGDSVLCRSTGTTVKQWFISSISIQGFCTEVMGEKNKRSHRVRLLISIRSRRDGCLSYKRVMVKKAVSQKEEHGDKVCSTVLLIRHLVWHPSPCNPGASYSQSFASVHDKVKCKNREQKNWVKG